ncbi:DNA polymerase IV [Seminavis robusta]|uniref:DNA polymerase IV n=1 Tax=Seminavis robusta TaxID=568900 RepID=A0A9N8HG44_9STRA|nr:DNA polymerase IV [Seminavis robusta]|eukprot:Sro556_g165920.1 DNA polymerase IV (686) ;mRNA; f:20084-22328
MSYYSDLSADSSSGDDESDNDFHLGMPKERQEQQSFSTANDTTSRMKETPLNSVIVHLDIDCFYCQCEHLDRKLPPSRPLAIGQKHIIVTSNYAARKLGVKKLQGREDAYKACPSLLIVEGSDLERYRRHGRKVYDSFRACLKQMSLDCAVSRGRGMDEMQADVTSLVDTIISRTTCIMEETEHDNNQGKPVYIYGDQQETATLTEDQTGAEAIVQPYSSQLDDCQSLLDDTSSRRHCQERLLKAASNIGRVVRQTILKETGFTTSLGFSINPLLAKLASDLHKPQSVNVLYPWRSSQLILSMPLRKIPDAGYKTLKLLHPALERFHGTTASDNNNQNNKTSFWTCRDLLELPRSEVTRCLENEEQCNMLLQRCQGVDTVTIDDDNGEPPKTVSVENSFRRGTVTSPEAVWKGLEELYVRLPCLLKDRREWSQQPHKAYPTTLKLTARVVDRKLLLQQPNRRRRPFVTRSKQVPFRGQELMQETNPDRQKMLVQNAVQPLVQSLVLNHSTNNGDLNVTRLNIAVTKFQDIGAAETTERMSAKQQQKSPRGTQQQLGSYSFSQCAGSQQFSQSENVSKTLQSSKHVTIPNKMTTATKQPRPVPSVSALEPALKKHKAGSKNSGSHLANGSGIDPATLAELPPQMAREIVRDYNTVVRSNTNRRSTKPTTTKKKAKTTRIDQFFKRR